VLYEPGVIGLRLGIRYLGGGIWEPQRNHGITYE
jgi:hypothetical protein